MFTWNIQFVSRKRLEDTLAQLMVSEGGDRNILVRIHTAIHTAEEAVDLAASVKRMIPNAQTPSPRWTRETSGQQEFH